MRRSHSLVLALGLALIPRPASSQDDRGAAAIAEAVEGLGTTARVLMIGAHPDDEDTRLITWLARGRHVETAYLSLTRGDGGQNLIGNELGEALGAIRTEELLAARRIDGALQYFTRAYDFGFSKSADETYRHWPKDTLLGDVVRVVRAFRPHVIVAVFSGTERDGHGHHTVSGLLAREVFDAAADTVRYPRAFGDAWATPKLYHNRTYWRHEGATYRYNAGEYDPVLGMSYAEIAGRSRSQHKSQAFGSLEPKGAVVGSLARERTRVNEGTPAEKEQGIFDGIDTTVARIRGELTCARSRPQLDSLPALLARIRSGFDHRNPNAIVPQLLTARMRVWRAMYEDAGEMLATTQCAPSGTDASVTLATMASRLDAAVLLAQGIVMEATVPRDPVVGDTVRGTVTVTNRGRMPVALIARAITVVPTSLELGSGGTAGVGPNGAMIIHADSTVQVPLLFVAPGRSAPWWLASPRRGAMFGVSADRDTVPAYRRVGLATPAGIDPSRVDVRIVFDFAGDGHAIFFLPVTRRWADPVRGEIVRPAAFLPRLSVTLDGVVEYAPARTPLDRTVRVHVRSADTVSRRATVRLALPAGLTADSTSRTVMLAGSDARATVAFRVRGRLPPGRHDVTATVESGDETFRDGYVEIDYEHIRPQRLYRPATTALQAVDVAVPAGLRVAYVPGVGDNVAPMLAQLGVDVTVITADAVASTELSRFNTVVLGPRVYEAHPALAAANARLLDWARAGGTLVVQYQQDIVRGGLAPYPLTLAPRADRVTEEDAPVRVLAPTSPLLTTPNRITNADFAGWVQERGLYMPRTFDAAWTPLLEMADPGMDPNRGALLVAPLGRGTYVLTTLSFFRQLPAGNPGAARLFVNLLSARR